MGVEPGANILLMADVTRIAWAFRKAGQRFSGDLILGAFLDRIGEAGTLVVPTFNYDLRPGEAFDVRRTPTISGALGLAALAHPAFARTAQPLHSFAVAGKLQRSFLQSDDPSSFGPRSSFALLREHGFQLIAMDMPLEPALTYVHFVEESMRVAYREWRDIPIKYTDHRGITIDRTFKLYAKKPGHVNDFKALEPALFAEKALLKDELDGFSFLKADLERSHRVIEKDIRENSARRIVKFRMKWWLRDLLRPLIRRSRPSRSALIIENAPRPH